MELQFRKEPVTFQWAVLRDVRSSELTQELKLSEGMPDIGRVICAWGQPILRGKEWNLDAVTVSAGMMVWVLYAPEDGSGEQVLETWIPFQTSWDLPRDTPEGDIRIRMLPRFVDARTVSARRIMVRTGVSAMAEAWTRKTAQVSVPEEGESSVELLRSVYPVRLPKEAGEKAFVLDEELTVPDSAPRPEKLVAMSLHPKLAEQKVLSGKLVFRGEGNLHLLYRSEEGQLHCWDFPLPFSQYDQLSLNHSPDAQADVALCPTGLEPELDEHGHIRLKCGLAAQYLITDLEKVTVVEDAYCPGRDMELKYEDLDLPAILETRTENLYAEQTIPAEANIAVDVAFLPDFPRQRRTEQGVDLEFPGQFQVLYYGEDGSLRGAGSRWEGNLHLDADAHSRMTAIPKWQDPMASIGSGQMVAKAELAPEIITDTLESIPMVTGAELGKQSTPDPERPSLILRRAGDRGLWDIAKESGSTREAIRRANHLTEDPAPGQMLLIPVP